MLEVGCGTGRLAIALAERGARVWAVDSSAEMLAEARARGGRVGFKIGEAEALPFKESWFERAVLRLVVHLVDRPRAFAELARVLAPGGRAVLATFTPEHVERNWVAALFPEVAEIDRARFPPPELLGAELAAAGFGSATARILRQRAGLSRDEALERLRGRYISTLRLLDEKAFAAGLARAERELPERVEYPLEWAVLAAELPGGPRQ